jgi:hypothetical protein
MKPVSWDKQLGLASPLETAASQSGKIKSPSNKEAGLDVSHHALVSREGRGENFFLDILFYRMSAMACLHQPSTCPVDLPSACGLSQVCPMIRYSLAGGDFIQSDCI